MIYTLTLNPAVDLELTAGALRVNEVNRATSSRKDCGGKGAQCFPHAQESRVHQHGNGLYWRQERRMDRVANGSAGH